MPACGCRRSSTLVKFWVSATGCDFSSLGFAARQPLFTVQLRFFHTAQISSGISWFNTDNTIRTHLHVVTNEVEPRRTGDTRSEQQRQHRLQCRERVHRQTRNLALSRADFTDPSTNSLVRLSRIPEETPLPHPFPATTALCPEHKWMFLALSTRRLSHATVFLVRRNIIR